MKPESPRSKYTWCFDLTDSIASWLSTLCDPVHPGQIRYCLQGNLIEPSANSGLGASCLALKLAYQTGVWEQLGDKVRREWVAHVRSFQNKDSGYFEDPVLLSVADRRVSRSYLKKGIERMYRKLGIKEDYLLCQNNAEGTVPALPKEKDMATRRAETRQAIAALLTVNDTPTFPISHIPGSPKTTEDYLDKLPWYWNPWHAASQTAHHIFFLKLNADVFSQQEPFDKLLAVILTYLDRIQAPETGAWFKSSWLPRKVPANQQVNAAMKILTAYGLLQRPFRWPDRLIDLCLASFDDRDACHSVDVIFVLHECAQWTSHRRNEIESFAERMLERIKHHRKPDGGLSFYQMFANTSYYGVPISRGLPESDVHGSHLLVWAITLCADLLGFKQELGWRFPIT
jgi:hypothetical protein